MRVLRRFAAALLLLLLAVPVLGQEGLGAETRYPTPEEAGLYCLTQIAGRWNGQLVTGVTEGGAAAGAGLQPGDMLLSLDADPVHSRDDVEDFFAVARKGDAVRVRVKRIETFTVEQLSLIVAQASARAPGGMKWHHAGPGQLDVARERARKEGKAILIGLSGAET